MLDYQEPLKTKTTTIDGRYHTRLLHGDKVLNEMACRLKEDISFCCYYMLRWHDKLGNIPYSKMADAARHRMKKNKKYEPTGKVWYPSQIPVK